jgi:cytochrome c oxidase assembly protein subunit 15
MKPNTISNDPHSAAVLTLGFGTTVAVWTVGYFCRLFGPAVPAPLLFALMLACLLAGGVLAGRYTDDGVRRGLYVGLLSGLLNLLIVGSLIGGDTPTEIKRGAILWVPGTLIVSAFVTTIGAALGARRRAHHVQPDWPGLFALCAVAATVVLLAAGGLVTGFGEGLAVVDWPNTEGYNMFLYPLARMTGGVYLEHAHRLLGSLVGLTVLVLAVHTHRTESRRWVRNLGWLTLLLVITQGILGGLRVTGRFTLSTHPDNTDPKVVLAIVHGVLGQIVLVTLVALAAARTRAWRAAGPLAVAPAAGTDRVLTSVLIVLLVIQLVLGALVRHFTWALALPLTSYGLDLTPAQLKTYGTWALHLHITLAVFVILAALAVGVRSWGSQQTPAGLRRLGSKLLILTGLQLVLGVGALIVTSGDAKDQGPGAVAVAITTAHQLAGAALLALATLLLVWNCRLMRTPAKSAATTQSAPA